MAAAERARAEAMSGAGAERARAEAMSGAAAERARAEAMPGPVGGLARPEIVAKVAAGEGSAGNRLRPDTTTLSILRSSRISNPAVKPGKPCHPSLLSHDSR